jgi:hypothetical protein
MAPWERTRRGRRPTQEIDSPKQRDRLIALGAGLTYGAIEIAFGVLLLLAVAARGRIPTPWLDMVKTVSHADVGAFAARWLLVTTRGLQRGAKFLIGVGLVVDGSLRAGLCAGALRTSRLATTLAAVVFGAIAIGGVAVAGLNPPPVQLGTTLANGAIAFVVAVDAYRLHRRRLFNRGL